MVTISEIYRGITKEENLLRLNRSVEMRIANIIKKELGLVKDRVTIDGDRFTVWVISPEKKKELQERSANLPEELRMKQLFND